VLLLIIYSVFCETFLEPLDVAVTDLIFIVIVVLCTQCALLRTVYYLSGRRSVFPSFTRRDQVAIMFTATHKSLTLGMPLLNILFDGDPRLVLISIPLLVWHPTQILLGGTLVAPLRAWCDAGDGGRAVDNDFLTDSDSDGVDGDDLLPAPLSNGSAARTYAHNFSAGARDGNVGTESY
jgi:predicted Na+-dependent transporter